MSLLAGSSQLNGAPITGTDRVLDIGCGNGRITRLADRGALGGYCGSSAKGQLSRANTPSSFAAADR